MSKRNYNLPEVQTKRAIIKRVDYEHDLCDIVFEGEQVIYENIKIHYHCDKNEIDKGGSSAFRESDYVVVLCDKDGYPLEVFGFVDKRKPCKHDYLIFLTKELELGYYESCVETISAGGIYGVDIYHTKLGKISCTATAINNIISLADIAFSDSGTQSSISGLPLDSALYDAYTKFLVLDTNNGVVLDISGNEKVPYVYCGNYNPAQNNVITQSYIRKGLTAPTVYIDKYNPSLFHTVTAVLYDYYDDAFYDTVFYDSYTKKGLNQFIIRSFEVNDKGEIYLKRVRFFNYYNTQVYLVNNNYTDLFYYVDFEFVNYEINVIEKSGIEKDFILYDEQSSHIFSSTEDTYSINGSHYTNMNAKINITVPFEIELLKNSDLTINFNWSSTIIPFNYDWNYPESTLSDCTERKISDYTGTYTFPEIPFYIYYERNANLFNNGNIKFVFKQSIDFDTLDEIQLTNSGTSYFTNGSYSVDENIDIKTYGAMITRPYLFQLEYNSATVDSKPYFTLRRYFSDLGRKEYSVESFSLQDTFSRGFYLNNAFIHSGSLIVSTPTYNISKVILNIFLVKILDYVILYHHIADDENCYGTDVFLYYDNDKKLNVSKYVNLDEWKNGGLIPYNTNYIDKTSTTHSSLWHSFIIGYKYFHLTTNALRGTGENNSLAISDLNQTEYGTIHEPDIQRGDKL